MDNLKVKKVVGKIPMGICIVLVILFTIICVYPFYYVIISSVSLDQNVFLLPKEFTLKTYVDFLKQDDLANAFLISTLRTVLGSGLTLLCTSFLAYLVTKDMLGRKLVYRYVVITMYISAGLVPWYLTMRSYGLKDNFFLYILPSAVSAYYMILIKTYMESLPPSLEESAEIDGAGMFTRFFKIVMPLCKPILATVLIYSMVAQWNSWQDNFFLARDPHLQTVQIVLKDYINSADALAQAMRSGRADAVGLAGLASMITTEQVRNTAIVVTVIPIMCVYPFLQKYFASGLMLGAVKG